MTHLGDDLDNARTFVTSAISDMDLFLTDVRLDHKRAIDILSALKAEAKSMKARGIGNAAKAVIEGYQNQHQQPKIDGRLMALYKLVVQYSDGLDEIAPIVTPFSEPIMETNDRTAEHYKIAKMTLTELLPIAGQHAPTLQHLMTIDVTEKPEAVPQVSFESLMPEVTDTALRNARGQGKSVSISYAAENLFIENSQVDQVRDELDRIVQRFVKGKIGTPEQRKNAGLPRSGHTDVSAKHGSKGLNISVLCEGETIDFTPARTKSKTIFKPQNLQEVGT